MDPDRWPHLSAVEDQELREQEMAKQHVPELVAEWRHLRARGVPAGSSMRKMAELRALLLEAGEWVVVNE